MKTFYVTMSATQAQHHFKVGEPYGGGYVEVMAPDEKAAISVMWQHFGAKWAFLYPSLEQLHEFDRFKLGDTLTFVPRTVESDLKEDR